MTIDYTKQKQQEIHNAKSSEIRTTAAEPPKSRELEERICTECYAIGRPRIIEEGSWWGYILPMFFDERITLYGCRECNRSNTMVPLQSHEGQQAMHWHLKKKGGI